MVCLDLYTISKSIIYFPATISSTFFSFQTLKENTEPILSVCLRSITSFFVNWQPFIPLNHSVTSKCWKSVVMTNKAPSVCPAPPVVSVSWNALGKSKVIKALPDVGAFPIPHMHLHSTSRNIKQVGGKIYTHTASDIFGGQPTNCWLKKMDHPWIPTEKIYLHPRWDVTIHLRLLKSNHNNHGNLRYPPPPKATAPNK